jgi:DNA-binding TFAR19-related protein (PDSD5 family)
MRAKDTVALEGSRAIKSELILCPNCNRIKRRISEAEIKILQRLQNAKRQQKFLQPKPT